MNKSHTWYMINDIMSVCVDCGLVRFVIDDGNGGYIHHQQNDNLIVLMDDDEIPLCPPTPECTTWMIVKKSPQPNDDA